MINETTWQTLQALWPPHIWEAKCINALKAVAFNGTYGLVNEYGLPMSTLNDKTWGIDLSTCHQYCNSDVISFPVFDFGSFASCLTNYLLPWLTLTAQLPYETDSRWSNIMSFFLAVGSPALVTFSLTITILNRAWVKDSFKSRLLNAKNKPNGYETQINAARFLLQEGQQVPLRASQDGGWLCSLIVLPENATWWTKLDRNLDKTKRRVTASLVAQTLFATLAYIFIIISSFDSELGDPTTALQIASGSLWIWLVPVIWGWISVGTQRNESSIDRALEDSRATYATRVEHERLSGLPQMGIVVQSETTDLVSQLEWTDTASLETETKSADRLNVSAWWGASVAGDEQRKGPIYNYARLLSWWKLADTIERAFSKTLENVARERQNNDSGERATTSEHTQSTPAANQAVQRHPTTSRDPAATSRPLQNVRSVAKYCGLDQPILVYPEWRKLDPKVWRRLWIASVAALTLQWGTTGASIVIAYETYTKGLSCRSGSYLIYGTLGTLAWLFLVISMLVSHEIMLRCQKAQLKALDQENPRFQKKVAPTLYCAAAVCLRRLGKFLATVNALWLVASSLMEFIGLYDNCWCSGDVPGLGDSGWIVLFKNKQDLRNSSIGPWIGGTALTFITCTVACIGFNLGCWESERPRDSK